MAVKLGHGTDDLAEHSEINVTPFIDVMLVLLIIFMVAAPLATVDVPVDLPAATAKPQPRPSQPIFISLKADLTLALGDDIVPRAQLTEKLKLASKGDQEQRLFLRADKQVPYGELMQVMNLLRDAGFLKVALVGLEQGEATPLPGSAPVAP